MYPQLKTSPIALYFLSDVSATTVVLSGDDVDKSHMIKAGWTELRTTFLPKMLCVLLPVVSRQ